jgi:hypothetical protein
MTRYGRDPSKGRWGKNQQEDGLDRVRTAARTLGKGGRQSFLVVALDRTYGMGT